ncbi:efflux RND transporter periplasmic adaptor subunit [Thauera sinica]|uniref:Efflux RND transporter periplasmic adaptor subunit n=1 Tax=Thauera sinica TaxID=2665146 RepID=A0ABW1AXX7_9RHOO|nr:efflux RND transporter periplasmic adaptor subunit [Thauera sp. K11]
MIPPFLVALLGSAAFAAQADVPVVRIEAHPVMRAQPAEATIEAVRQSVLAAQVAGRVVELAVDAGDAVRRGQVLMRIDAAEAAAAVAGADAGVARAEADLINARAEYERARSLVERRFVSQSALDQARTRFDAAEAQLRAARAGRGQAATVQGYTTIASPLDGLVAARHIERGEMAQPGRVLLTVYDPTAMRALVDLPQQRIAELGGAAALRARIELPDRGRSIDAAAVTVLPAADARTHTVRVRVDLPAGTQDVLPGSFARVHFHSADASTQTAPVMVPPAAVLRRGELTAVYVVDGRGGFTLRQVRIGQAVGPQGEVEVLAGLAGGESVAVDPVRAGIAAQAAGPVAGR